MGSREDVIHLSWISLWKQTACHDQEGHIEEDEFNQLKKKTLRPTEGRICDGTETD